jgi:hypothetical protein
MDIAAAAHANPFGLSAALVEDVAVAIGRVSDTTARVDQLIAEHGAEPVTGTLLDETKDARLGAKHLNEEAQGRLQSHFDDADLQPAIESRLHLADGALEDSNWQLAKNPSPDGRFAGLDLAGSRNSLQSAMAVLSELVPY